MLFRSQFCPEGQDAAEWDLDAMKREFTRLFGVEAEDYAAVPFDDKTPGQIRDALWERITQRYAEKERIIGPDLLKIERDVMLQIADTQWKDHLYSLDHLKEGIGLRGYGQRDPLVEYKKESFGLFTDMKDRVDEEMVRYLFWLRPVPAEEAPAVRRPARRAAPLTFSAPSETASVFGSDRTAAAVATGSGPRPARTGGDDAAVRTVRRDEPKVGRNDPCPCGSGKKYKKCHGLAA